MKRVKVLGLLSSTCTYKPLGGGSIQPVQFVGSLYHGRSGNMTGNTEKTCTPTHISFPAALLVLPNGIFPTEDSLSLRRSGELPEPQRAIPALPLPQMQLYSITQNATPEDQLDFYQQSSAMHVP